MRQLKYRSGYSSWLRTGQYVDRILVEARLASCIMGTGPFLGWKWSGHGARYPPASSTRVASCLDYTFSSLQGDLLIILIESVLHSGHANLVWVPIIYYCRNTDIVTVPLKLHCLHKTIWRQSEQDRVVYRLNLFKHEVEQYILKSIYFASFGILHRCSLSQLFWDIWYWI